MAKAIIYCRVSSVKQVENTSLGTQMTVCEKFIKERGDTVSARFVEKGESAKTADRTELQKLLSYIREHDIDYLVVYKIDRFSRNTEDFYALHSILERYGVKFESATENFSETPAGRLTRNMLAAFAQFDNDERSYKTTNGMKAQVEKGKWMWQTPLGFVRKYPSANISPDPNRAPLIKRGFEEYAKGLHSYKSLANFLTDLGLRTVTGKAVSHQWVEKMIKNELYCGRIIAFDKDIKSDFGIISETLFYKCQGVASGASRNADIRLQKNENFPLRKHVMCTACGVRLTGSYSRGKSGMQFGYYHHGTHKCSSFYSVNKVELERQFTKLLEQMSLKEECATRFKNIVLTVWKEKYEEFDQYSTRLNSQLQKLQGARQQLFEYHLEGKYSDDDFNEQKERIASEIELVRIKLSEIESMEYNVEEVLEFAISFAKSLGIHWNTADYTNKKRILAIVAPKGLDFDGEKLGTPEMSLIFEQKKNHPEDDSSLVTPRRIELRLQA